MLRLLIGVGIGVSFVGVAAVVADGDKAVGRFAVAGKHAIDILAQRSSSDSLVNSSSFAEFPKPSYAAPATIPPKLETQNTNFSMFEKGFVELNEKKPTSPKRYGGRIRRDKFQTHIRHQVWPLESYAANKVTPDTNKVKKVSTDKLSGAACQRTAALNDESVARHAGRKVGHEKARDRRRNRKVRGHPARPPRRFDSHHRRYRPTASRMPVHSRRTRMRHTPDSGAEESEE